MSDPTPVDPLAPQSDKPKSDFEREGPLTGPDYGAGEITPEEHEQLAKDEWLERREHHEKDEPFPGQDKLAGA